MTHDVLIVGAGPVGTTFARYMAEKGFKVGIIEKKASVGVPLQCAGLLGKQIKEVNILPDELIINPFYGAYLHSPSDHILKVAKNKPEAYVVDRVGYDKFLAQQAVDAGAELYLKHNVKDLDLKNSHVLMGNGKKDFIGKIIAGADGNDSIVSNSKFTYEDIDEKEKAIDIYKTKIMTFLTENDLEQLYQKLDENYKAEKNITESLQEQDYELAEKIKSCMFVFEDILTLDDVAIQRILRDVETKELALALKGASEEVANVIYKNQSKRAAASLKEDIEYLGPVRLTDVEKAQQQIVAIIRRLEDAQEIIISRGGEDALIM